MSPLHPATDDCATARFLAAAWLLLVSLPAHATDYSGLAVMLMTPVLMLAAIGVVDSLSLIRSGDVSQACVYLVVAAAALAGLVRLVYRYMRAEDAARASAAERLPAAPPETPRVRMQFHLLEGVERRRLAALLRGAGAPPDALLTFTDSMRLCGARLDEP